MRRSGEGLHHPWCARAAFHVKRHGEAEPTTGRHVDPNASPIRPVHPRPRGYRRASTGRDRWNVRGEWRRVQRSRCPPLPHGGDLGIAMGACLLAVGRVCVVDDPGKPVHPRPPGYRRAGTGRDRWSVRGEGRRVWRFRCPPLLHGGDLVIAMGGSLAVGPVCGVDDSGTPGVLVVTCQGTVLAGSVRWTVFTQYSLRYSSTALRGRGMLSLTRWRWPCERA